VAEILDTLVLGGRARSQTGKADIDRYTSPLDQPVRIEKKGRSGAEQVLGLAVRGRSLNAQGEGTTLAQVGGGAVRVRLERGKMAGVSEPDLTSGGIEDEIDERCHHAPIHAPGETIQLFE